MAVVNCSLPFQVFITSFSWVFIKPFGFFLVSYYFNLLSVPSLDCYIIVVIVVIIIISIILWMLFYFEDLPSIYWPVSHFFLVFVIKILKNMEKIKFEIKKIKWIQRKELRFFLGSKNCAPSIINTFLCQRTLNTGHYLIHAVRPLVCLAQSCQLSAFWLGSFLNHFNGDVGNWFHHCSEAHGQVFWFHLLFLHQQPVPKRFWTGFGC